MKRIIGILFCAIIIVGCSKEENQEQRMLTRLQAVNELELARTTVSKTFTVRDQYFDDEETESHGIRDVFARLFNRIEHSSKAGDRVGVYGVRRTFSAYIDLSEMTPEDIVIENNILKISLPPIKTRVLGNDLQTELFHERISGLRDEISETERIKMKEKATAEIDREMLADNSRMTEDMIHQAKMRIQTWIITLARDWGYDPEIKIAEQ